MCRYSKAFVAGTSSNVRGVVEIDEFAVMCCIRLVSANRVPPASGLYLCFI